MKTIILLALAVFAFASTAGAQESFAPEAGLNISNYKLTADGQNLKAKLKIGVKAGAIDNFKLKKKFDLQYGFFYMLNGYKMSENSLSVSINSVEVPLNLLYRIDIPNVGKFSVGIGPYFAFNFEGTDKETDNRISINRVLSIGSENTDDLKAFDVGLGLNIVYPFKNGIFIRGNYQVGLLNLSPVDSYKEHSANYGLSAGYFIKGKKAKKRNPKKPVHSLHK